MFVVQLNFYKVKFLCLKLLIVEPLLLRFVLICEEWNHYYWIREG